MRNANLVKLYESAVIGEQIVQPRHIVREFYTKKAVIKAITDANPNFKAGSGKKGSIRIQPTAKVEDKEALKQEFIDTLNDIDLIISDDVIYPGDPDSPSGKFPSYRVKDKNDTEFIITLGGGAFSNEGMNYERALMEMLGNYFDNIDTVEKPVFLEKLENHLDVEFEGLDKETSFTRRVKRPLTDKGPDDKGDEIADLTLIDTDGKKYYISLKNVGGKTVSNAGASGMFDIDKGQVKFVNKEKNDIGKKLMDAANVNIKYVTRGLTDYLNKSPSPSQLSETHNVTEDADKEKLMKFLGSAFDYGYIYVKQKNKKDDLEIADLSTEDELFDFIGEIESVNVRYPYFKDERASRKGIDIMITTTKHRYAFQIRNPSGGIMPNQINLVKAGSTADVAAAKANVKKVSKGDKDIESLLK